MIQPHATPASESGEPFSPPSRQLYPGTFEVRSKNRSSGATSVVGHVYVEGAGSNLIVEHWALRPAYASPDNAQDMVVVQVSSGYNSLSAFLSAMHAIEAQTGQTFSYVRADCYSFSSLPD